MPKIQWERLPREKWAHLRERAKERHISEVDLFELAEWKAQDSRRARRQLVQGFRNVQALWHSRASEPVSPAGTSRARQAIVPVGGLSWGVGEVRKPQTHLLCAGFRSLSFKLPQKERRPRRGVRKRFASGKSIPSVKPFFRPSGALLMRACSHGLRHGLLSGALTGLTNLAFL